MLATSAASVSMRGLSAPAFSAAFKASEDSFSCFRRTLELTSSSSKIAGHGIFNDNDVRQVRRV